MLEHPGVLELFGSQHHVATVQQLLDLGVGRRGLDRARRRGRVVRVLPAVVALTGSPLTFEAKAMAVQLRTGPTSFLSGPTAARLRSLRSMLDDIVEVTVPEDRLVGLPEWGRVVRTSWLDMGVDAEELESGFRVATPLRMLFGLASQFSQPRFERAAEDAWHLGLVTPEGAERYLQAIRRSGKSGVVRFETWLEKTAARSQQRPSQSNFERDVIAAICDRGLPEPVRQHPVTLPSRETIHLDIAWPDLRYGIEPGHTWWHGGNESMRRDQARDRACAEIGWLITRLDEKDQQRLPTIAAQVERTYRERQRLLASSFRDRERSAATTAG